MFTRPPVAPLPTREFAAKLNAMLYALSALTLATARDALRRGSTLILAGVGAAVILSLRWFSAFGLGYEVNQLKELGVYTIGLMGAVGVLLVCLPNEDEPEDAEALILTRPVSGWVVSMGTFLGRATPIALLFAFWTLCIGQGLWWLKLEDPLLFEYRGAESVSDETVSLFLPVLAQFFATGILLAFVQPLARIRRPVVIGLGTLGLYVLGYAVAGLGGIWSRILPDLLRHDLTATLWGSAAEVSLIELMLHACAWCAAGVALDSISLKVKSVAQV